MIGADMAARPLLVRCTQGKLRAMSIDNPVLHAFRGQAASCRSMGSALTASVLEALADGLDENTATGRAILGWTGEPLTDALPLRLAGGLHALARSGNEVLLTTLYRQGQGDPAAILADVVRRHDQRLLGWLDSPPQTNEVGRSAALIAGLAVAAERFGTPFQLLELGSSAGLNLHLDRFAFTLGTTRLGKDDAPVRLLPDWSGGSPPPVMPRIADRAGVDQAPVDVRDPAIAERLIAYVWPDQAARLDRIEGAIAIARQGPMLVEKGDAADWIEHRLATPQADGVVRAVMHSVFWQYLPEATQQRIDHAIRRAGERATAEHPLIWLSFEPGPNLWTMALTLRTWPGGEETCLAHCHPHAAWIEWMA
jgi:hypothetical protein